MKIKRKILGGGGSGLVGFRVDVNEELKFLEIFKRKKNGGGSGGGGGQGGCERNVGGKG